MTPLHGTLAGSTYAATAVWTRTGASNLHVVGYSLLSRAAVDSSCCSQRLMMSETTSILSTLVTAVQRHVALLTAFDNRATTIQRRQRRVPLSS